MKPIKSIERLTAAFRKLPGVGPKTAQRYALSIVEADEAAATELCEAVKAVKRDVRYCSLCGNYTEDEICDVCRTRDSSVICVVAYPKDVPSIEKTGYTGVYHILHGTFSPRDGRGVEDLGLDKLMSRMSGVKELIIATNPDLEGEATALYISGLFKKHFPDLKITRPAQGISVGSDMEYADEATLTRALAARREM